MGIITESVSASPGWGVAKRAQCTRLVTRDGRLQLQCAFIVGRPARSRCRSYAATLLRSRQPSSWGLAKAGQRALLLRHLQSGPVVVQWGQPGGLGLRRSAVSNMLLLCLLAYHAAARPVAPPPYAGLRVETMCCPGGATEPLFPHRPGSRGCTASTASWAESSSTTLRMPTRPGATCRSFTRPSTGSMFA